MHARGWAAANSAVSKTFLCGSGQTFRQNRLRLRLNLNIKMKMMRRFASIGLGLALLAAGCSRAGDGEVVVALKPDKDPDRMHQEQRALETWLAERLDRPARVVIPTSGAVIIEGLANGTIDAAYISATEMIQARDAGFATLLLAGEIDGKTSYSSYWVSLKEKPYESVADLRDRRIAFSSRSSTSGFIVPFWDLHKQGLVEEGGRPEDFFGQGNVWYGIGYVTAVERVLAGEAEAAAVSYYVLDEDRHLTAEQRDRLKKVAEQGPVPTHVIAVRRGVDDETRAGLRRVFLELNEEGSTELRDKIFTSKLVEVDEEEHLGGLFEEIRLATQPMR